MVSWIEILALPVLAHVVCVLIYIYTSKSFSNFGFINVSKLQLPHEQIKFYKKNPSDSKGNNELKTFTINDIIQSKIPGFRNNALSLFNPFLSVGGGHMHTMFAGVRKFKFSYKLNFKRMIIRLEDNGSAALDFLCTKDDLYKKLSEDDSIEIPESQISNLPSNMRYFSKNEIKEFNKKDESVTKPIVILLHGLSGSSSEAYVRCISKILFERYDFDCVVLNSRGCGLTQLTTPSLFCALWTHDLRHVVDLIKKTYPNRPIYAMGFSLGGDILANFVGQEGEKCKLNAVAIVGAPWDLCGSSDFMSNDLISNYLYSPIMAYPLSRLLKTHYDKLKENEIFKFNYDNNLNKINSIKSFDDYFTSKLFGFNNATEYYREASPVKRISKVRTPLLIISSIDDPICGGTEYHIPYKESYLNPYITLITTTFGGHIGWFKWNNDRWYSEPLSKFFYEFNKNLDLNQKILIDEKYLPNKNPMVDDKLPVDNFNK